jgi:glycogen operon protein
MNAPNSIIPSSGTADILGASYDGKGVNFAIFSAHATKIELCLFDDNGKTELQRIALPERTGDIWHGYLPDLKPGQVYGYRVHGPYDPANGHLFNPNRLVLDPYARETIGEIEWTAEQYDFNKDNAAITTKARVAEPLKGGPSAPLNTPWNETRLYELHVKGFTKTDTAVTEESRGTIAALAEPSVISDLQKLGVTAVELLPIHSKVHDHRLEKAGLKNYWGYNNKCFFTIEPEYLQTGKREELRDTVAALHAAGIEVIIDVVYNHTGEGKPSDPFFSFRGIDNANYYKLDPNDKSRYIDETGCANTLNFDHPQVRRMALDSLRYLVEEFGIDGFRFDEAPILGRSNGRFSPDHAFFKELAADPVLSKTKLIAESWDCSSESYQVSNFPANWHEWNAPFRDDVRAFWRGDANMTGRLASRLSGSSNEFNKNSRGPQDSINMVTCHDGFSLQDLVSYSQKQNFINAENNRDGINNNLSHNYGVEGPTDDIAVRNIREQQKRNMLATLFLAHGTPMLLAGDEFGNTQGGNNNTYCQDNEIGWLNKDKKTPADLELTDFTAKLIQFRMEHIALTPKQFMHGNETCKDGVPNLQWISPSGNPMSQGEWNNSEGRCFGMLLNDNAVNREGKGERILAVFNSAASPVQFNLPKLPNAAEWQKEIDTGNPRQEEPVNVTKDSYTIPERSVVVFTQKPKLPR